MITVLAVIATFARSTVQTNETIPQRASPTPAA
ncbi:MAG: hypothetical protein J07HX64_02253 [halophilic archaeon J07HX64]|nr:MAG: hypothetical protein J07HX64_02253 [halophilic archaeon J07HX64]